MLAYRFLESRIFKWVTKANDVGCKRMSEFQNSGHEDEYTSYTILDPVDKV